MAEAGPGALCAPKPLADLTSVLEPFWEGYACNRDAGMGHHQAAYNTLGEVLQWDDFIDVLAIFGGAAEDSLDGRRIFALLLESGEGFRMSLRRRPDVSDPLRSSGENRSARWLALQGERLAASGWRPRHL